MKNILIAFLLIGAPLTVCAADTVADKISQWTYQETARFKVEEARQAVVADDDFLYVITNHGIGKYAKSNHERVASWSCPEGEPLIHVNAGLIYKGKLYGAHSNFPGVPNASSVEIWDPATLKHVDSISFGITDGSLTWFDRHDGKWMVCFVAYGRKGGEPGKGPEWSRLVEYDNDWRPTGRGWNFPNDLMAQLGAHGFSVSGGAFGPGGFLYVTGHDDAALYVLEFPEGGPSLKWVSTVPISTTGQAFDWDNHDEGVLYTINKPTREVVIGRLIKKE